MMKEQLELVDVAFEDSKATLTFLDEQNGEIREVNFNKKKYNPDTKKFEDDDEKAEQVEKWCEEYFNCRFSELGHAVGDRKDVYCYEKFNSLFEVKQIAKFGLDYDGQILSVEIVDVKDNGNNILIDVEYEGEIYQSKMGYSTYLENKQQWFVNPEKRNKQYTKFKEKFNVDIEDAKELIGKTVMVEVKKWAFSGKSGTWIDIKPLPKKKK